jgi:hypothetical protein
MVFRREWEIMMWKIKKPHKCRAIGGRLTHN